MTRWWWFGLLSFGISAAQSPVETKAPETKTADTKAAEAKPAVKVNNQVYKCENDGVVTFSQMPCGKNAEQVTVRLQQEPPPKDYKPPHIKQQREVAEYLENEQKAKVLARHRAAIEQYKAQLKAEFEQLKSMRFHSLKEKELAVQALSSKYNGLIAKEQEAIKALLKPNKQK